jgi:hypothetical protein
MTTLPDLHSLRARIAAATGPDRELDRDIEIFLNPFLVFLPRASHDGWEHPKYGRIAPATEYTDPAQIGAVIALIERDGWKYAMGNEPKPWCFIDAGPDGDEYGANVSLAALAAFVDAMIWKGGAK